MTEVSAKDGANPEVDLSFDPIRRYAGSKLPERRGKGRPRLTESVAVGLVKDRDALKLRICIAEEVAESLGWADGIPVEISIGTGLDRGRILCAPGARGYTLFRFGKTGRYLELRCPLLDDDLGLGLIADVAWRRIERPRDLTGLPAIELTIP